MSKLCTALLTELSFFRALMVALAPMGLASEQSVPGGWQNALKLHSCLASRTFHCLEFIPSLPTLPQRVSTCKRVLSLGCAVTDYGYVSLPLLMHNFSTSLAYLHNIVFLVDLAHIRLVQNRIVYRPRVWVNVWFVVSVGENFIFFVSFSSFFCPCCHQAWRC